MTKKDLDIGFYFTGSLLILMNVTCTSMYFSYNSPQLLSDQLTSQFQNTSLEISYLYTIFSVPNFIGSPLGGYIISRFGVKISSLFFNLLIFISSVIIFMGIHYQLFWMIIIGRGVYGLGAENIIVSQSAIAEKWFTGRFLSFANGLNSFFNQISASIQDFLVPALFTNQRNLEAPFFLIGLISFMSFLVSVTFFYLDTYVETKKNPQILNRDVSSLNIKTHNINDSSNIIESEISLLTTNTKQSNEINSDIDPDNLKEFREFLRNRIDKKLVFNFYHVKYLGILYWLLCVIFVIISQLYFQSINFLTPFLQKRFGYPYEEATNMVMLQQIVSAFSIPLLSSVVVVVGYKGFFLIASSLTGLICFLLFYFLPARPNFMVMIAVVMIGLQYSLYCCVIWSSMTLSVPKEATGIALSLVVTFQNILMTILPVVFGYINQDGKIASYQDSILLFIIIALISLVLCSITTVYDIFNGGVLQKSENDKSVLDMRSKRSEDWKRKVYWKQFNKMKKNKSE